MYIEIGFWDMGIIHTITTDHPINNINFSIDPLSNTIDATTLAV